MAKRKAANGNGKVPNKAIHSRISFLYQAATYLANQPLHSGAPGNNGEASKQVALGAARTPAQSVEPSTNPLSRRLASDLRETSLKAQLRVSPKMKYAICKNCDTILLDGSTCTSEVENRSKGGKKPWADVLARKCNTCGVVKRYPLAAPRQKRRPLREEIGGIPKEAK
ncbi:Rpr2-domain-containing protein [Acephala macrosclerotiorum]|nr:Rpr2-domain-containing protein [Acephala macrosclerotiorum]